MSCKSSPNICSSQLLLSCTYPTIKCAIALPILLNAHIMNNNVARIHDNLACNNRRSAVRLTSGKWRRSLVKEIICTLFPEHMENALMVAIATRSRVMAERKFATCPTCQQCGQFDWLGEQRWPEEVARRLGLPSVITLWSCPSCMTTISDGDLLPPQLGKNYTPALEASIRKP